MSPETYNTILDEALILIQAGTEDDEIVSNLSDMYGWDEATLEPIVAEAHPLDICQVACYSI